MIALLDMAACGSLCVTLLHSLWQMTLLAIVAGAIGLALGKDRLAVAYWVHVAALLAGVLAIPSTYAIVHRTNAAPVAMTSSQESAPITHALAPSSPLPQARPVAERVLTASLPGNASQEVTRPSSKPHFPASEVWRAASPWLAIVYLIGVALMLLRLIGATIRLERLRAAATPLTAGPVAEVLADLCRRWKTSAKPTLAHAANIVTPAVVGFLKPTILLPTSALTGLSLDDLEMILAHELAHLRRHDAWVNLAQRLAEAVLFFHPAMWWLSRRVSTLREYCCDEAACAAIADSEEQPQLRYATALLRVVELSRGVAGGKELVAMAAAGRSPSELRRRVARLFGEPLSEPMRLSRGGVMAIVLGVAAMLGLAPLAESQTQKVKGDSNASTEADRGTATISGTIVLDDGRPADAMGWLHSNSDYSYYSVLSSSPDPSRISTSSTEGYFADRFECKVKAGEVSLLYYPDKTYAPAVVGPFQLKRGDVLDGVVIKLTRGEAADLLVSDEAGRPIAGAMVVSNPQMNGVTLLASTREEKADQDGKLEASRLTPGAPYVFTVEAPGYQRLQTEPTSLPQDGRPLRLSMRRAAPATGLVLWPDGSPCPQAKVKLLSETAQSGFCDSYVEPLELAATDAGGRFTLDSLNDGSCYLIMVEAPDASRVVVTDIVAGKQDIEIVLRERHDLVVHFSGDIDQLPKRNGKPSVRIQQHFAVQWKEPRVGLDEPYSTFVTVKPTEGGGEARFAGLAIDLRPDVAMQEVGMSWDGGRTVAKTVPIKRDGDRVTRVVIELPPGPPLPGDLGSMQIRVFDSEGQPLPASKVYANRARPEGAEGERFINSDLVADSKGVVTLPVNRKADTIKLWAWAEGKVSEFVYLDRGPQEQDALLPAEYEFRLDDGTSLGGVVVDDNGKPIPGVHVRMKVGTPALGLPPGATSTGMGAKPIVNSWLTDSFYQPTVKTDAKGRWRINNAPGPLGDRDHEFSIKLEHPDYQSDGKWGDLQRRQGVTTPQLRAGDAKIVMTQGVRITGAVVDTDGRPITNGWVVWSDEPYFFDSDAVTRINDSGHFTTPQLKPGEYPVIVIAPGYAAQKRTVRVEPGLEELRFELKPGKRIEIRIVDANGAPVPNVSVYLGGSSDSNTWDRSNALHNQGGPTEYGIPRRANEQGVYVWDWAPEGAVRYDIGAKGYAGQEVRLVPKSEPHVITLAEERVVVGTVTDALGGEPVDSFLAMPVIVFGPEHWSTRLPDAKAGLKGEYTLPLRGAADEAVHYRVRIEAPGYRTIVSEESFGPKDGRKTLNVQLEPAPARIGRVIDAEGQPVANAALLVGTPTWVPMTFNGEADEKPELRILTDAEGRFELAATTEPSRVRVVHDVGFAEALIPADAKSIGELQLEPWAMLTGTLTQDGQPVGDQQVFFAPFAKPRLGEARFQDSYYARTNPRGEFTFDRLPPIAGSVRAALGPWEESPLTSSESLVVNLQPGETHEVTLGGEGAVLTGRVNPTGRGETPLDSHWSLNYLVSRDRSRPLPEGFPALGFDPSGPLQVVWMLDPHFDEWLATRANHFVKLTPDGRLRVTGVEPGEYDLLVRLYEQPAGCLVEAVGEKVVPVSVNDNGVIDLGQIDVPCRVGPRVGSDMRAYGLVDATGRKVTVNDLAGRHVVLHVWASWCQPCLATMPEIAATAEDLADRPVTFVGLNVDADGPAAEALAAAHGWKWAQNYLGEKSDLAKQLALSTVPSYYLIGPDGKLIVSSSDWKAIRRELELAFPAVQLGMR